MENREHPIKERVYYSVCCPAGLFGAYLWGTVLVLAGGFWLLRGLKLIPLAWGEIFWPLLLIGFGLACLINARQPNRG